MPDLFIQPQALCIAMAALPGPCLICGKILPAGLRLMPFVGHQPVCVGCGQAADENCTRQYKGLIDRERGKA